MTDLYSQGTEQTPKTSTLGEVDRTHAHTEADNAAEAGLIRAQRSRPLRLGLLVVGLLGSLLALLGCQPAAPGWVGEAPVASQCGAPTKSIDGGGIVEGTFADVYELPNGLVICVTDHREETSPLPEESDTKVTVITMALQNRSSAEVAIDSMSKNVRTAKAAGNAAEFYLEGYVGEPQRLAAGQTAMIRMVYRLPRSDWPTAWGLYTMNDQFTIRMTGLA